jgi:hypothetical protein
MKFCYSLITQGGDIFAEQLSDIFAELQQTKTTKMKNAVNGYLLDRQRSSSTLDNAMKY